MLSPSDAPSTPTPQRIQTVPLPTSAPAMSTPVLTSTPNKPLTKAAAMLERIREKERKKLEDSLFKNAPTPEDVKMRLRLSRLEDVVQCLLVWVLIYTLENVSGGTCLTCLESRLYVSSRKNVLPLITVAQHVANGCKSRLSECAYLCWAYNVVFVLPPVSSSGC